MGLSLLCHPLLEPLGPEYAELALDGLSVRVDDSEHLCRLHARHAKFAQCNDQLAATLYIYLSVLTLVVEGINAVHCSLAVTASQDLVFLRHLGT